MYSFKMKLAEKNIYVECLFASTEKFCAGYLTDEEAIDIKVFLSPSDIESEREKSKLEQQLEGLPIQEFSHAYLETLALYRKIAEEMPDFDTILFHGSALAIDGEGYIFTAKSGVGKSTHSRLWRECFGDRVVMVNDDKPLIRITPKGAYVYGTPWCGKHGLGNNTSAPVRGIVLLERSSENRISESTSKRVFPKILSQIYRPKNILSLQKTLTLTDRLLCLTNVYELGCNMDPSAARVAYEGMRGNTK